MRILLVIIQTIVFLFFAACVLLGLYMLSNSLESSGADYNLPFRIVVFGFGSIYVDIAILAVLTVVNILIVLGPLMKIEDPAGRTLLHLGIISIQFIFLLSILILAFVAWLTMFAKIIGQT